MTVANSKQSAPCGAWISPIVAARVAAGATPLSGLMLDGGNLYWLEGRASEAGRITLVAGRPDAGAHAELTPLPFNVRSRVHEYGGGAYAVAGGEVWFSHHGDNRLYHVAQGGQPIPLTAEGAWRYADFVVDAPVVRADEEGREVRTVFGFDATAASAASATGFAIGWRRASCVTCCGPSSSSAATSSSFMVRSISLRRIWIVRSTPRRPPAMRPYR